MGDEDAGQPGVLVSVVVGFNDSEQGRAALSEGVAQCVLTGDALVVAPLSAEDSEVDIAALIDQSGGSAPQRPVSTSIAPAPPENADRTEHLLTTAATNDARLLVIGLRRQTTTGKLILGSHAQRVLLGANCPVLTVTR